MRYRSQNWLNNRTQGTTWNASASYVTGSHSMKFGYQGNHWRDDREMHVNNQNLGYMFVHSAARCSRFAHAVHQPVQRERARDADVVLRAGPVDDESPHAAGRAPLGPSLELVPGAGRSRRAGSSPARPSPKPTV